MESVAGSGRLATKRSAKDALLNSALVQIQMDGRGSSFLRVLRTLRMARHRKSADWEKENLAAKLEATDDVNECALIAA